MDQFKMITASNIYDKSALNGSINNKKTQIFLAEFMVNCLEELDINNLESIQYLKDIFQYTIKWEYPQLQSLIFSLIAEHQHA